MKKFSDIINDINKDIIYEELITMEKISDIAPLFLTNKPIFEGIGIYEGCFETVKMICNKILNKPKKDFYIFNESEFNGIQNVFFRDLFIYNINDKTSQYDIKKSTLKWDDTNKIFNYIEIIIDINYFIKDLIPILVHELNHAYKDWKLQYNKSCLKNKTDKNYNKTIINKLDNDLSGTVKMIKYYLYKFEFEAFISQIVSKLHNKYFDSIDEAYKFISNDDIFKNIINIKKYIDLIQLNNNEQKFFINEWERLFNEKISVDKIYNKFNKLYSKFINHIYLAVSKTLTKSVR